MRPLNKLLIALSLTATLLGCASTESDEAKNAGFLSNYSELKEVDLDDDSITKKYISDKASLGQYKKVFIEPVSYYPAAPTNEHISQNVQDEIKASIEKIISSTYGEKYQVVNQAGADTFTLKVAITGLIIDDKSLSAYQYLPIAFVFTAAKGSLNDMSVKLQVETEAVDSKTGEVLAAFTKLAIGEKLESKDTELTYQHLEPLLKRWSATLEKTVNK